MSLSSYYEVRILIHTERALAIHLLTSSLCERCSLVSISFQETYKVDSDDADEMMPPSTDTMKAGTRAARRLIQARRKHADVAEERPQGCAQIWSPSSKDKRRAARNKRQQAKV
jgi:hypothetical protein